MSAVEQRTPNYKRETYYNNHLVYIVDAGVEFNLNLPLVYICVWRSIISSLVNQLDGSNQLKTDVLFLMGFQTKGVGLMM
jgi:hypothetical protein